MFYTMSHKHFISLRVKNRREFTTETVSNRLNQQKRIVYSKFICQALFPAPYWSKTLNKKSLTAKMLSKRTGYLELEAHTDFTLIGGYATIVFQGETVFQKINK